MTTTTPADKPKRTKKPLHWAVKELFDMMKEKKWSWEQLSQEIEKKSGKKISGSTLRFWSYGYSVPKVDELDLIAGAFGLELELMPK